MGDICLGEDCPNNGGVGMGGGLFHIGLPILYDKDVGERDDVTPTRRMERIKINFYIDVSMSQGAMRS